MPHVFDSFASAFLIERLLDKPVKVLQQQICEPRRSVVAYWASDFVRVDYLVKYGQDLLIFDSFAKLFF